MKTIIIDCNNLIHKNEKLKKMFKHDRKSAQLALMEIVNSRTDRNSKVIFVFDGHDESGKSNVIFSGNVTADRIIRDKIEKFGDYKKLRIISSDKEITDLAKVCGAEVIRSEDYWKQSVTDGKNINQNYLYDEKEKPDHMSRKDMDEFRKYFT